MKVKILILFLAALSAGCAKREYYQAEFSNPAFRPNLEFRSGEDLTSPKFEHLRIKYQLDTIFHGETDEFKRILLLRHWIKTVIRIDDHGEPYPGDNYAEGILDGALKGHGYHCGHYMVVQNAVLNAYGYVTRTLGAGPGVKGGPDGHHGIDEVWSNQFNKWFLSDAKYDHHFEKNGIPLSALEIRDELLKNKCADIIKVKGPGRVPFDIDQETGLSKVQNAQTYTWIEWHGYNDMFTVWPDYKELLIMYNDDYYKSHTWIWDNKPHWAYSHPECLKLVSERDSIYWTPNTISSDVKIKEDIATISLTSATPNLKEYQMKQLPSGNWMKTEKDTELKLKGEKMEFVFRTVNLADVTGPEHHIVIENRQ
jgi:hypothetical protein